LSKGAMVVGILRVTLHVPEAQSLKDRRAAVRRAVERVRARFNVSVAEVGDMTRWQVATVAVAVVSNDRAHVNEVLDRVTSTIAGAGAALVTQREMEIQSYGDREPLGGGPVFERGPGGPGVPYAAHGTDEDDDDDDEPGQ
jgi:uncharacterized protein YlxP (DUF503 family)